MYYNEIPPQETRPAYEQFRIEQGWTVQLKAQSGLLALTLIVNMLILYLFQTVGVWMLMLFMPSGTGLISQDAVYELYNILLYLCAFFLPYLLYAKAVHYPLRAIVRDKPYPPVLASCTGVALGLSVAGTVLYILTSYFFAMFGLYPMDLPMIFPGDPFAMALYLLNMTVVPALVEEFAVRGVIMGSLRQYGDRFAIGASALVFALLHRNMTQFPNAFLLGLALGYFVIKTNSIWTGVVIHGVNNLLAVLVSMLIYPMSNGQALFVQGLMYLLFLAAAGCGLLYLLVIRRLDTTLRRSPCPLRESALYRAFLLNFPALMMLALFAWVIFLNFTRY